jgi:hypothetical protein
VRRAADNNNQNDQVRRAADNNNQNDQVRRAAKQNAKLFGNQGQDAANRQRDDAKEFREKDNKDGRDKNADRSKVEAAHDDSDHEVAAKI